MSDRGTLHIDQALTNVAIGFKNESFISGLVLPSVPVNKESDKYFKFGKENFRVVDDKRADGSASNRVRSWTVSNEGYSCDTHSIHDVVTARMRENADAPIAPDVTTTKRITEILLLRKEIAVANAVFNVTAMAGYTSALAGNDRWDDKANSDPIGKIDTAKSAIKKASGYNPNTLVIGREVFDQLKRHPDILDVLKYSQPALITPELLASVLGIKRVVIGDAVYNSAQEGATVSMNYVWGKYALICYVPETPAIDEPSFGYNFNWKLFGTPNTVLIEKWTDNDLGGDKIQGTVSFTNKITAVEAGYLFSTVIS